jgi:hypothetical protein
MPFDGLGFPIDDRVSKIDQIIDLLATPNQWCKAEFKTRDGRYCIRGAMTAVEGADFLKPIMLQAIREVTGERYLRIGSFNDHPYTQHAQVLRVLMRARRLVVRCLVPGFDGALFSPAWRDALWARFFTAAPPRQRRSVERYSVVKRA